MPNMSILYKQTEPSQPFLRITSRPHRPVESVEQGTADLVLLQHDRHRFVLVQRRPPRASALGVRGRSPGRCASPPPASGGLSFSRPSPSYTTSWDSTHPGQKQLGNSEGLLERFRPMKGHVGHPPVGVLEAIAKLKIRPAASATGGLYLPDVVLRSPTLVARVCADCGSGGASVSGIGIRS